VPIGWFIAPYRRRPDPDRIIRECAMNDFTALVVGWSETEVLGQHAIVKVNATNAVLTSIAGTTGVQRIPVAQLDSPLSSLSNAQRNAIRNKIISLGYTVAELDAAFPGDIRNFTLRQLLTFVARRRRKVRYDEATDAIVDDGPDQPVRPLEDVDGAVV
jgi:hypothetical protein